MVIDFLFLKYFDQCSGVYTRPPLPPRPPPPRPPRLPNGLGGKPRGTFAVRTFFCRADIVFVYIKN